jgi:NAD(P)H-dependent FMN reductase
MKPLLHTVIVSTRPGRIGPPIAHWFHDFATQHGKFETKLIDLADFNLPIYDEPSHPKLHKYEHEHTKRWSESVAEADAYVFVTPEFNFCPPPSFVNALNYLYREWNYKPCGFVSYGGVSGGMRAVQMEKHAQDDADGRRCRDSDGHEALRWREAFPHERTDRQLGHRNARRAV